MTWPNDRFPSAQEILERLRELAGNARYSAICTVLDFVAVGGKGGPTQGNEGPHTTNYVRIGRQGVGSDPRSTVVIIAGVHAREWAPPTLVTNLVERLLEAFVAGTPITLGGATYTKDQIKDVIEKVDLYIAPMINPDGYEWTRNPSGERLWRKNRRPPPATLPSGCTATNPDRFGVDINRNFDVIWEFNKIDPITNALVDGTFTIAGTLGNMSRNPCEFEVYVGASAASERETQNVAFLLDKNPQYFVDVHMSGRKIYYSWGTDGNHVIAGPTPALQTSTPRDGWTGPTRDDINEEFLTEIKDVIGNRMSDATDLAGTRFDVIQGASLGAFSGASDDYAMSRNLPTVPGGRQPIRAYTIECGLSFTDDFGTDFPITEREVQAALLALLVYASSPLGLSAAELVPGGSGPPPSTSTPPPRGCTNCSAGEHQP